MTTLTEQIEELRIRMNNIAAEEIRLISALSDGLASVDQRLLEGVRSVTAAHEARRGIILKELQMLAARIGTLPMPGSVPSSASAPAQPPLPELDSAARGGDWRKAIASMLESPSLESA